MKRYARKSTWQHQPVKFAPWSIVLLLIIGLTVSTGMMPLPMAVGTPAPSTTVPAPTAVTSSPVTSTNAITATTVVTPTQVVPTATQVPPTATRVPPTATSVPPTATKVPPTATQVPPTATAVPPTATVVPPTATAVPAGPDVPILVKFKSNATTTDVDNAIKGNGGKKVRELKQIRTHVINVPASQVDAVIAKYAKHASVERVTAAIKMKKAGTPNDPGYAQQWALPKIGWNNAYGVVTIPGSSTIAILDTGVDATHPDLAARIVPGQSFVGGDPNTDPNGHGTSMAGIAAANTNNGAGMAGVAYAGVNIMSIQVLQADGTGYDSDIVSGVVAATDAGAKVILMGFYSTDYSAALADALAYAWSNGVVLVAATGNDGSSAVTYPAGMPNVIGAAATDANDNLGANSNTGSASVAAPGVGIYTTLPGGGYGNISGTSASAAHVAGLAALLTANGKNNVDASNQIRGATDPVSGQPFGRINVAKALGVSVAPLPTATRIPATPTPGATPTYVIAARNFTLTFAGTGGGSVTISVPAGDTVSAPTSCGGTGVPATSQTVSSTCSPNITLSNNSATGTLTASGNSTSYFFGWSAATNFTGCTGTTTPCSFSVTGSSPALTVTFTQKGNTTTTASNATTTYGDSSVTLNATVTSGAGTVNEGTVTFTVKDGATTIGSPVTSGTVTSGAASASFTIPSGTAAKTYTIQAVYNPATTNPKFNTSSDSTKTLTVNKATLTVTADNKSKIYGDANPALTVSYSGFQNGETLGTSGVTGSPSCSTTATTSSPVTTYPITCTTGTLAASNYSFSFVAGTLTINKAVLTVTADDKSRTYGDANPVFTASYSGFKNGETLATSGVTGSPSLTTLATPTSAVPGPYTITAALGTLAASNYSFTFVNGNLTITKAHLTVTADNTSRTYGDANPTFTATLSGFKNGETLATSGVTGSASCASTATPTSPVPGPYSITCTQGTLTAGNYDFTTFNNGQLTVNKAVLTVTADDKSRAYGDANPTLTATFTGFKNGENLGTSGVTGAPSLTTSATATSAVSGSPYTITAAVGTLASGNYQFTFVNGQLTVTPATLSVTADNKSREYGDANPAFTFQMTGFKNGETSAVLTTQPTCSTAATQTSNAGTYPINCSGGAAANYSFAYTAGTLTVNKATLTVTADNKSKTYGDADPSFTFGYSGFKGSDNASVVDTAPTCNVGVPHVNIGTYTIACSGGADNNYDFSYVNGTLTINKRAITVTADAQTKTYGDADPALTYQVTSGSLAFSDTFSGALTRDPGENIGTYAITQGTLALNANYNLTYVGANLTIGKRAVTVTADAKSKTYGDADPALTYQITSGSLAFSDAFTGALSRVVGENVGTYAIQQHTLALNSNYTLTYVGANLTIGLRPITITADAKTKVYGDADPTLTYQITSGSLAFSDAFSGNLTRDPGEDVGTYAIKQGTVALSGNYTLTYVGANLTITKATLTVTADNKTITYGDPDPAFSFQYSGFKSGDTASVVDTAPTCGVTSAHTNAGTYAIKCSGGADNNYAFSYVDGTLVINQRAITITADAKTKVYGNSDPALTYQITSGALVSGDSFTGALTRDAGESVGTYAINQGTVTAGSNYNLTYVPANLTITARPITVTADPKSKVYGDTDPSLTYQITSGNLVNGDSFTGALSRDSGENVGTYAIKQGSLTAGTNYNLSYVGANLTITVRAITVTADAKSKTYGDSDPALTYHITTGSLAFSDAFTGALTRAAGEDVGTYAIQQGTLALNSNYMLTYVGANLTIGKRAVTVTADAKSKTYGDADPALTYQITSGSLAFSDTFSGSLTRDAGETVGTYAITQGTVALSTNYDLTYIGANLVIDKRPVTITADAKSKTYGDADPALTYKITSGSLAFSDAFTGSLARAAGENVGVYAIQQGTVALSSNYDLSYVGANLTITQRPVTITADAKSKVYGDADPALTYQITSGSLAFSDAFTGALSRAAGENVGDYAILQGTVVLSNNYTLTYVGANLTITKKPVTVTAEPKSKVYGESDPALTYTYTPALVNGDSFSGALTRVAGEDVGIHAILQGTLTLGANYQITYHGADLTITKRPVTITADPQTKVYGNADPALTYKITSGSLAFSDAFTGNLTRVAGENVGTYAIQQGTVALSGNYDLSYVGADLTITVRPITVTADAQTKVYGNADPALTYKITSGSLAFSDAFTGALSRATGEDVGTYAIQQGTLALSSNYTLTYVGADLTITQRPITITADAQTKVYGDADPTLTFKITTGSLAYSDGFNGALTRASGENVGTYAITQGTLALNNNYALTFVGANLIITQRPVTVTADAKSKTYGDSDPALTYKITSGNLVNGDTFTGALSRVTGEHVGTYAIQQNTLALSGNYMLTYVGADLSITPKTINVTANAQTKVYGDADPNLTYTFTPALITGDTFTGALTRDAGEHVGQYNINQGTLALSSDYTLVYASAKLTITPKTINVTADAKSKVYGESDPGLTYQFTPSLVNGDNFSGALSRDAGENVGQYNIVQGTLALSGDYTLNYSGALLTITQRAVTVTADAKTKTYGDDNPALTATVVGTVNGDILSYTLTTTAVKLSNVGDYPITVVLGSNPNYNVTKTDSTLHINQKDASVTADAKSKTYGDDNPDLTATVVGEVVGGDAINYSLSTTAVKLSGIGGYPIVVTLGSNPNYNVTKIDGTLTINKKDASVTADNKSKTYGDDNPGLTATVVGQVIGGDALNYTLATGATKFSNVGDYAITVALGSNPNYNVTKTDSTLHIGPKDASVAANNKTKTYGDDNPVLDATVTGTVNGDTLNYTLATTALKFSGVGDYPIVVTLGANPNYNVAKTDGTLHINQKDATVVANNKSKTYGDDNPTFDATVTGTVNGDILSYTLTTTAVKLSNVGDYAITVVLGANPNYNVTKTDGTLHINQKDATVVANNKTKVYGEDNPTLDATVTGQVAGGDAINYSLSTTAVKLSNVGNYPIVVTLGANPNYNVTKTDGTLTINQANTTTTVSASANPSLLNQSVTFTAQVNPVAPGSGTRTGTVSFYDGATLLGTGNVNASGQATFTTSSLAVGAHTITATYSGDSNFNGSTSSALTQQVNYAVGGTNCYGGPSHTILQPINADGTSVAKQGSTVPAKFRVCDANGNSIGTPGVVKSFVLDRIMTGTVVQDVNELVDSTTPYTEFRWSSTDQQWIFNISTKNLKANKTYVYLITLNDGSTIQFQFGLK